LDGNVIGVNTAIYSPSGGNVGIAFDIMMVDFAIVVRPKDTRREFLPQPGVSIIRAASHTEDATDKQSL
jgi:S1-C subfamily serine protease